LTVLYSPKLPGDKPARRLDLRIGPKPRFQVQALAFTHTPSGQAIGKPFAYAPHCPQAIAVESRLSAVRKVFGGVALVEVLANGAFALPHVGDLAKQHLFTNRAEDSLVADNEGGRA
jgi:hypothetical protein